MVPPPKIGITYKQFFMKIFSDKHFNFWWRDRVLLLLRKIFREFVNTFRSTLALVYVRAAFIVAAYVTQQRSTHQPTNSSNTSQAGANLSPANWGL